MTGLSIEQRRAAHALKQIRSIKGAEDESDYRSYVTSLPASIVVNGLGQAMAMQLAQGNSKKAHLKLYEHVSSWLCGGDTESPFRDGDLIDAITTHDQNAYMRAQYEALAYLEWLKKFAAGFLKRSEEGAATE